MKVTHGIIRSPLPLIKKKLPGYNDEQNEIGNTANSDAHLGSDQNQSIK